LAHLADDASADLTPGALALANQIGDAEHLVFVLADGLGLNLLEGLPEANFLTEHRVGELRTVFPSTTATVLTTLATGAWPNQHGVTGQWTHLSEIRGAAAVLPFAARSGGHALGSLGVGVEQVFPLPPLLGRLRRDTLALFPSRLVNSVTSTYFSGGRPRYGYESLTEAVQTIVDRVRAARAPTYTYLYSPRIDTETHWLGVRHDGVRSAVHELNRCLVALAEGVAGRARVVVAADHGLLDAPVTARHWIKPTEQLISAVREPLSGDDRVLYFHVRDGAEDRLRAWLKAHYGDRFFLLSVAEAEDLQLFGPGPAAPAVRERFGDLLLLSTGVDVIEYVPTARIGRRVDLNAFHSGLSPAEMRVPLVVF
ncbi:MAG TPA: alkaline phosphatase family protein, partial [Chloroflexota bacterium]|nr:alkaline phosphatase family protein [Chloroflexota bacterium]